nr:hypothetical protein [Pandoravirus aubagnensis]
MSSKRPQPTALRVGVFVGRPVTARFFFSFFPDALFFYHERFAWRSVCAPVSFFPVVLAWRGGEHASQRNRNACVHSLGHACVRPYTLSSSSPSSPSSSMTTTNKTSSTPSTL